MLENLDLIVNELNLFYIVGKIVLIFREINISR